MSLTLRLQRIRGLIDLQPCSLAANCLSFSPKYWNATRSESHMQQRTYSIPTWMGLVTLHGIVISAMVTINLFNLNTCRLKQGMKYGENVSCLRTRCIFLQDVWLERQSKIKNKDIVENNSACIANLNPLQPRKILNFLFITVTHLPLGHIRCPHPCSHLKRKPYCKWKSLANNLISWDMFCDTDISSVLLQC